MSDATWSIESAVPGIAWPPVPSPGAAQALAMLRALDATQWLPAQELALLQLRQLDALLRHAWATVPYYEAAWSGMYEPAAALDPAALARLPVLSRRALQDNFDRLKSSRVPREHGAPEERRTSGSTGAPVRLLATPLSGLMWNALTLRDHAWHARDLTRSLAVIRRESEDADARNWGPATAGVVATGPALGRSIFHDAASHLDWLLERRPAYLFTYPSLVAELARLSIARGVRPEGLREVRTLGETVTDGLRGLVRDAWRVPLTDLYSANEAGYLALQCPASGRYHVQSENVLLEVLDDAGRTCAPGEVGRVVVTPLHNFAMPLVRYEIGDYAEVGAPCACGRGLPVLERIVGRVRNMLTTADGRRYWPVFGARALMETAPVRQFQFVQTSSDRIVARLVCDARLSPSQEAAFRARVLSMLPAGLSLDFAYVADIPRAASGKFEEFVSEVSGAPR